MGSVSYTHLNEDGLLSLVKDPVGREKKLQYDNKKQLIKIIDVDGEEILLSYANKEGLLNGITNIDGYQLKYEYTEGCLLYTSRCV